MPFSKSVKERTLVAAARHCCVCHRYKGLNIEVHHINQESESDNNTFENAIALCFDCHADAGHYNPRHPRGTSLSASELRHARDRWFEIVATNSLSTLGGQDSIYCRYLLCKSFSAITEIARRDLQNLPVTNPLLVRNAVYEFFATLAERHPDDHRPDTVWGDDFSTKEEYSRTHPEVEVVDRTSLNDYPYFEALRTPTTDELRNRVAHSDSVTRLLLGAGVETREISRAFAYTEICGGDYFQEVYRLRPLWAAFMAVTNVSGRLLYIDDVRAEFETVPGCGYRGLGDRQRVTSGRHSLPAGGLEDGTTLVFPVATLLGPMPPEIVDEVQADRLDIPTGEVQIVSQQSLSGLAEQVNQIGPAAWPTALSLRGGQQHPLHEFDMDRLYVVDRVWECGSCPYLFFGTVNYRQVYASQLFGRAEGKLQSDSVTIPEDVDRLYIVELEDEVTWLTSIRINRVEVVKDRRLAKGDVTCIHVKPGDEITLQGFYRALGKRLNREPNPWTRNLLVLGLLNRQSLAGTPADKM